MNKSLYRWEADSDLDYEDLLRPDGTIVTTITEPEDRRGYRDLAPITVELNRLHAAVSWQPIETAPKDGAFVLLHGPTLCPSRRIGRYDAGKWLSDSGMSYLEPTAWMPLPPPPERSET